MGKRFRYLRSVKRGYTEQGRIFFQCQSYPKLDARERRKIDALCQKAGGEYAAALKALLCTPASWQTVCMDHAISSQTLNRVRRRFYESW